MRTRTAVLLGASGLVGGYCLHGLIATGEYSRVVLLLRKHLSLIETLGIETLGETGTAAGKVEQVVMNLGEMTSGNFTGVNDVFCTLGTNDREGWFTNGVSSSGL